MTHICNVKTFDTFPNKTNTIKISYIFLGLMTCLLSIANSSVQLDQRVEGRYRVPSEQVTRCVVISIPLPVFSVTKWMIVSIEQGKKCEKGVH